MVGNPGYIRDCLVIMVTIEALDWCLKNRLTLLSALLMDLYPVDSKNHSAT